MLRVLFFFKAFIQDSEQAYIQDSEHRLLESLLMIVMADLSIFRLEDATMIQRFRKKKGGGKHKKTLKKTIRKDIEYLKLTEDSVQNRAQ
ncbi:hypothetical protein FF1_045070 [Malus domestica]